MKKHPYKLDRSKFKMQSFEEADNHGAYWSKKTPLERMQAAWYLISVAYNFDLNKPPKFDRTSFSMRKLSN